MAIDFFSQTPPVSRQMLRLLLVTNDTRQTETLPQQEELVMSCDVVSTPDDFQEYLRETSYDLVLADYDLQGWTVL